MVNQPAPSGQHTILISCVGRRIELVQAFRRAGQALGLNLRIVGTDSSATAPGLFCVDVPLLLPPIASPDYLESLQKTAVEHKALAIIPTIDTELLALAQNRDRFDAAGVPVMVADADAVSACSDKAQTFAFLREHGIDTPQTWLPEEIRALSRKDYPYFIKPRAGSASIKAHKIEDAVDLEYYLAKVDDAIIQEFVDGREYTLDVYVGLTGVPRCVVPRLRWAVRGGEVSKGIVVKDADIMAAGRRVAEALGSSCRGLITLQCIVTADKRIRFIEINPRFGGGAPLSVAAGADFPRWLLQELLGQTPEIAFDGFTHGTCMLRYDWSAFAVFDDLKARTQAPLAPPPRFLDRP